MNGNALVQCKLRYGGGWNMQALKAKDWDWSRESCEEPGDILAYRVVHKGGIDAVTQT